MPDNILTRINFLNVIISSKYIYNKRSNETKFFDEKETAVHRIFLDNKPN